METVTERNEAEETETNKREQNKGELDKSKKSAAANEKERLKMRDEKGQT